MAQREVVTLNETTPQLEVPQSGDTYLMPRPVQIGVASTTTGTIALGHASSAHLTTIQPGNAAAAVTYTLPTNVGAAGAALTDAAGNGTLSWAVPTASPAGADTQVQFNDGGAFAGDTGFTFDKTNNALTLGGATVTTSNPVVNLTQTWNAAVTFTAIKLNVTSTSSNADSLLMDLQVGGASKAKVNKSGALNLVSTDSWMYGTIDYGMSFGTSTNKRGYIGGTNSGHGVMTTSNGFIGFSATATSLTTIDPDTTLYRDAADTLALRRLTNAQEFRTYGTYTSATQYHYVAVKTAKTTLTASAGATITATNLIPDGAFLIGVTTRVNTTCTTATGYTVGDGSDADLWGVASAVSAGTATSSADFTAAAASGLYIAAQSVVITATGGSFDGTGAIEVVAHYLTTVAD